MMNLIKDCLKIESLRWLCLIEKGTRNEKPKTV